MVGSVVANPLGGAVVQGKASIQSPAAGTLDIVQSTQRAIINWQSFSIGSGEQVNFLQPSSSAATLNRVLGNQTSVINGALNSNGQVFLLNGSGIIFGKTANINVGSLVATTSAIGNSDFIAGRLSFAPGTGLPANILNAGTISIRDGGFAALVAPGVANSGVINARLGRIALGGGDTFTVDLYGDRLINFALPAAVSTAQAGKVSQSGSLIADGGQVLLTTQAASAIVGGVVNMSGLVQARNAGVGPGGEIVLDAGPAGQTSVSGTLDVSSGAGAGGSAAVYGGGVALDSTAQVTATGTSGGGVVRIGGGFAGEHDPQAGQTSLAPGSLVDVSALSTGDAGKVAVWGTDSAKVGGTIAARGGAMSGNAGFVEVSGKDVVRIAGTFDETASHGHAGTLLLDPTDITIEPTGGTDLTGSTISGAAIDALLRKGVTVKLLASDTITVNDIIDGRPVPGQNQATVSGAVSLQAGIIVLSRPIITNNAAITLNATTGDITFQSTAYLAVANTATASDVGTAAIHLTAAGNVAAYQLISLGPVTVTASGGNVQLLAALNGLQSGNTTSGIGALNVAASGSISSVGALSHGNVQFQAGTTISTSAPVDADGSISLNAQGAGGITIAATSAQTAALDAGNGITLTTPGAVTLNASLLSTAGNIQIGASSGQPDGSLTMAGGTAIQSVTSATSANQGAGISIFTSGNVTAQNLITGSQGALVIGSGGAVTLGSALTGLSASGNAQGIGSLAVTAAGNISTQGALANGAIDLTSSGGAVSNSIAALQSTDDAIGLTGQTITLNSLPANGGSTYQYGLIAAGDIALASSGTVTLDSSVLSNGGNIQIGASTSHPVASLVMGAGTALQSVVPSTGANPTPGQNGGIAVYTGSNFNAGDLIAGSAGNVLIDSGGAVTLDSKGLFGLDHSGAAAGIGQLTINATGNVSTKGALVNGAINLTSTGGALTDSTAALQSTNDAITLTAQAITLNQIPDAVSGHPADAVLNAHGDVTLATTGAVKVNSAIVSQTGNIQIGSGANPVASLSTTYVLPGWETGSPQSWQITSPILGQYVLLKTNAANGSISVQSAGSIALSSLIAGNAGTVNLNGHDVMVAGSIDDASDQGVGAVSIGGTRSVTVHGIKVSGSQHVPQLPAGSGSPDLGDSSLELISGATTPGGSINVLGPIFSGGPVFIGQTAAYQASANSVNSQVNLSDYITTAGKSVTINGDVTLFKGITQWDIQCALTGVCLDPNNRPDLDVSSNPNSPTVFSAGTGGGGPFNPLPAGVPGACVASAGCTIGSAVAFGMATATPVGNAQTPYTEIICGTASCGPMLSTDQTTGHLMLGCSSVQSCTVHQSNGGLDGGGTTTTVTSPYDVNDYVPLYPDTLPENKNLYVSKVTYQAVGYASNGNTGVLLAAYNTQSGGGQSDLSLTCAAAFICGYATGDFLSPSPSAQDTAVGLANTRLTRMSSLFGALNVVIDTTESNSANGGAVTVTGNVGRYRGPAISLPAGATDCGNGGACPILPSFVSDSLTINAGSGHAVTIRGGLGDDTSQSGLATWVSGSSGDPHAVDPTSGLGNFDVTLTGSSIQLSGEPTQYGCNGPCGSSPYFLNTLQINAPSSSSTSLTVNSAFFWLFGNTFPGSGALGSPGNAPPVSVGVPPSSASGGNGISLVASATSAGGATAVSTPGLAGLSGLPTVTETSTPTGPTGPTNPTEPSSTPLSTITTAENTQQESNIENVTTAPDVAASTQQTFLTSDSCPRGAGQLADLGQRAPVDGAAPDVFARCP